MEVGRVDVKLNDTKVANGSQGEDGAEGFQTHCRRNRFPVIDSRTLEVVLSNESTLVPLKDAILELLMKYQLSLRVRMPFIAALVHRRCAT